VEVAVQILTVDRLPRPVLASIDVQRAFIASRLIVAAESFELFRLLHGRRMTQAAIGKRLKIHDSQIGPFLLALVGLGLLRKSKDLYANTLLTEKYFIKERTIYWTRQYSNECVEAYEALSVLEQKLATGRSFAEIKGVKKPDYVERMKRDRQRAEDFTQMLFHLHKGDAEALAGYLDLSEHRAVLDVAGGSGVMSIALAKKNPHIRGCVLDIAPVCEIAAANVKKAGLSRRISTCPGDIRKPWPPGYDVVLLCDIGEISPQILKRAYESLPPQGLVVLVDRYMSEDGIRPLDRLLDFFVSSSFPLATHRQMAEKLRSCGFAGVKASNVFEDVWFITGAKPRGARQP
jgi:predicted O-methyltransferase YrrM